MNVTANKAMAFATLNKFANSREALIAGMKAAGYSLETARGVVIEWACEKTGAEFKENEAGKITLVREHRKYEGAKTVVRDIMLMLAGTTRGKQRAMKEVDVVATAIKYLSKLTPAQLRKVLAQF